MRTEWISFLTDYGTYDGFVAACHGVVGAFAPAARVVDITHDVPPGDIRRGAVVLAQTAPYLPTAVHVGVVDPGVGTGRRAIAVETPGGALVGPDNGLLGWAAEALGGVSAAVTLTNPEFHRQPVTATFHGRDIFAPVAAHLANGVPLADLGEPVTDLVTLRSPVLATRPGGLDCEVLTVDRFGNIATSADAAAVETADLHPGDQLELATGETRHRLPLGVTFGSVPRDQLLSYVDSVGLLSVAVNGGNAASRLRVQTGDPLEIRALPSHNPSKEHG